jgi:hypothetical protein
MPQVEDTTFILSFTAFDAPVIPTAGVHDFSFVIDEDCRFTAIRVKGEAEDYADDEEMEGHIGNTHEQASGVFVHAVSDDDDGYSPVPGQGHSAEHSVPPVNRGSGDLRGIFLEVGLRTSGRQAVRIQLRRTTIPSNGGNQ